MAKIARKVQRQNPEVLKKEKTRNAAGRKFKPQCINGQEKKREMDKIPRKLMRQKSGSIRERQNTKYS